MRGPVRNMVGVVMGFPPHRSRTGPARATAPTSTLPWAGRHGIHAATLRFRRTYPEKTQGLRWRGMVQQVILERDAELAALAAAVAAAEAGHGSLVLVEGPAGIGKTTLSGRPAGDPARGSSPPAASHWSRASATASSASCSSRSAARTG